MRSIRDLVLGTFNMKYIAYLTKGLEQVAEKEIQLLIADAKIDEVGDKRVIFESNLPIKDLIELKTVDDLGLFLGKIEIKDINDLPAFILSCDLNDCRNFIKQYRDRELVDKAFSVTVGLSGSNLKAKEVVESIVDAISKKYSWEYTELDHTNFDIRVFVDHKTAYFSIRLTKESLHQRPYKTDSKPGSLKPSVAAAMVFMATGGKQGLKVVDNFCGSGTILCEALLVGNEVYGGDIDPESVQIARGNLRNLDYQAEDKIKALNALKTNWPDSFFDCAVSNLPWDEQIKVSSITQLYEGSIAEYMRIFKPKGILCALVSKPELFIKYAKKLRPGANIASQKIGLLGQNPTIVLVK